MEKFFEEVKSQLRDLVQAVQVIAVQAQQLSQSYLGTAADLMDNTDMKSFLKIRDTKLGELKTQLPIYSLDGKDFYFKDEIIAYIKANPKKKK
ncbi:hypothetical protein [Sphingobacterium detergens]|uniref:Helix-turn-helix protein n=1 Tax=Sphingobacterium detergens TaxID=1145106 RepID=A0A420ALN3_SPHD1|nr:hypothetical protein [Sphingobacterium detergens]RKE45348.1 hypothetical protein DFQ12_4420 [Sphingobacterium detergens]